MIIDYIHVLGVAYPNVQAHLIGDSTIYENIVWEAGDPLPAKADLDAAALTVAQNDVWLKIKTERDSLKDLGVLVQVGTDTNGNPIKKWFNSDSNSRIQQISLVLMGANLPANLSWKCMDNTYVTMTQAIATAIFQTTAYYDQTNFANAEKHRLAMLQAADPTTYDYTTGWLPSYNPTP